MGMHRLALISFRFPKGILFFWTIALFLVGSYGFKLDSVLKDHGLYPDGPYAEVQRLLASDFGIPDNPVMLLFEKAEGITLSRFRWFIEQTLLQASRLDGFKGFASPLERHGMMEGNHAYALLSFTYPSYQMKEALEQLKQRLPLYTGISIKATGKSVVQTDVNEASHHDLAQAELIGIPLAFLILWLVFKRLVIAMLPIAIGITGVTIAMGIMYGLGTQLAISNFVLNVIPMVGLALSIDFALMIVSRFREELAKRLPAEALAKTMKTAGRAVLFSAASIFFGLLSFLWIPLPMFSSIALGAITVLAVSVLLTFTLLPALLALWLPALYKAGKYKDTASETTVWHGLSRFVMKSPVAMGLLAGVGLIVCLLPLSSMRIAIPDAASLPHSYDSRLAAEAYEIYFETPSTSTVWVIAEGRALFLNQADWTNAYALVQRFERDPSVKRVDSVFSGLQKSPEQLRRIVLKPLQKKKFEALLQPFLKDNRMLLRVTIEGKPSSKAVMSWLREWERKGDTASLTFLLGGEAKYQQEVFDHIFDSLGYVILLIFISNFIVLFIAFRSVLIALKTIVMNLLSIGASFGILAWIFEGGRFGMEPGSIAIMIPVFIFGLVFGISMDYGVFLVSRIYEEYRRTLNNELAVLTGLASTSKIITSAAAIMIAVTAPFAFGEVIPVKQLGIGIAAAIFIDATVIRMVLVPSLMSMLGKWNWWSPGWMK